MKTTRIEDPELLKAVRRIPCLSCLSTLDSLTYEQREQLLTLADDIDSCMEVSDPDHVQTRGHGGNDVAWNLIPQCRTHHQERHQHGLSHMAKKYPIVKEWLILAGWRLDARQGKWKRNDFTD